MNKPRDNLQINIYFKDNSDTIHKVLIGPLTEFSGRISDVLSSCSTENQLLEMCTYLTVNITSR